MESVYQNALIIELKKSGLNVESEKGLAVYYGGQVVGSFSIDLLVNNDLVIELKSVETLVKAHEVQLVNYLSGLQKEIGLLINFGPSGVKIKRKYRSVQESS